MNTVKGDGILGRSCLVYVLLLCACGLAPGCESQADVESETQMPAGPVVMPGSDTKLETDTPAGTDDSPESGTEPEPDAPMQPDEPGTEPEPDAPMEPGEPGTEPEPDMSPEPDMEPEPDAPMQPGEPETIGDLCFSEIYDPTVLSPDYDQFDPLIGSHCQGTQHQVIEGVERVVFLGDSVTVGTPPTPRDDYYRSRLSDALVQRFGLEAPSVFWKASDPLSGTAGVVHSGDFSSCAAWGARVDDLMVDNEQILDCFAEDERDKKTLVIMTVGGNDLASITKKGPEGVPIDEIWAQTEQWAQDLRDAVEWLTDPANVPGGTFVVFANLFEFTDGTGDVTACAAASLAGFDEPWENPEDLEAMVVWVTEQYMDIAVSTGTDVIFTLEHFCGHGFNHEDPTTRCYRGPDAERWFDLSCTHPNPAGHAVISDMFLSVVDG